MVDTKKLKEVSASFAATAATVGSFPAPVVDGAPVSLAASGEGTLYTAIVTADGSVAVSIVTDNAAAGTPVGIFVEGIFRSTLPTYTNGDAALFHFDARGRLITVLSNPATGDTVDISVDDSAAPANPVGTWPLGVFRSTPPTYANGDATVFHFDARGRLITVLSNPTTGDTIDVSIDDSAAPTNPVGTWPLGKFTATAPTLTDGDASALHVNNEGRLQIENDYPDSASVTSVAASASSVSLLTANADRRGAVFFNDSASATLFLKLGTTASTTSYTVQIPAGGAYELAYPAYTGAIDGIWSAAVGDCRITEVTK